MERDRGTPQDRGFTLIELLIVIVVLGILATVTVFAIRGLRADAEEASCAEDRKVVETAVEAWLAEHPGTTAVSEEDLVEDGRLRSESSDHDVELDGDVVAVGDCEAYAPATTSAATTVPASPTTVDSSVVPTTDPDSSVVPTTDVDTSGVPTTVAPTGSLDGDWVLVSGGATSPGPNALSISPSASLITASAVGADQTVSASFAVPAAGSLRVRLAASPNGDGLSVRFYPGGRIWVRVISGGTSCWSSIGRGYWPAGVSASSFSFSAALATNSLTVRIGGNTVISIPDVAAEVASRCGALPVPTGQQVAVQTYVPAELTGVSIA